MKCVIYLISFVLCASYQADTRTSRSLLLSSSGRSSLKGEQKKERRLSIIRNPSVATGFCGYPMVSFYPNRKACTE